MNQRLYGQPPSSNSGPEGLSGIRSSGPPAPSVIVFEARNEDTARAEQLPAHFTSLVNDLSQEDGQLKRRRLRGLDNPRNVCDQLSKLEKIDLIQWPSQRIALVSWQELVIIAATIVDKHLGYQEMASSTVIQLHGREVSQHTITKDERAVREIIRLIDHLYLEWEGPNMDPDLALELLMLLGKNSLASPYFASSYRVVDTPLYVLRAQSARKYSTFRKLLQEHTPPPKIRSSFKLYIPFLVLLLRPKYKLLDIQKALGTSILGETDWDTFWNTSREPPAKYDPIRDAWTKSEPFPPTYLEPLSTDLEPLPSADLELTEFINYPGNYPTKVNIPISGFKAFKTSLNL
ncbi:hypothetical protein FGADI_7417 [Fusarium gaditjirri]|uniref:Uncharacterized protein n=1 Tax=Fusarium gaditjirri TaxID=282569 RepID=A0A8H4T5C5_9HYPO|nr:hypothetical protein FGADI_7417 [Fusarium gaditjirri]